MRVNTSVGYGLLAVGYVAQNKGRPLIVSQDIAKKYNIPLEYLLKIMQQLVKVSILRSKRGPRGGFSLARPLNKVTLLEVIEAIEGPMEMSLRLTEQAPRDKFAANATRAYDKIVAQSRAAFKRVKLSDLV
ncbi:MAG: RrF2 family transcriptional regulator [Planctomycetota bacterium]|jgi:Rrf2 family protein